MIVSMTSALTERVLGNYADHLGALGQSATTITLRLYYLHRFLRFFKTPWDVSTSDVEKWLSGHHWSPSTRRSVIASLRGFYEWATLTGQVTSNPLAAIHGPSETVPCPRTVPDRIIHAALQRPHDDTYWLIRIAATTGLRRCELAQIHSKDVVDGWLRVTGKGYKPRKVPIPPDVEAWLISRHGWAFPSPYGGHVKPDAINKRLTRATGWNAHSFRHHYATKIYHETKDLRSVQQLLGHASIRTTQRYISVDDEQIKLAAQSAWAA